MPALPAEVVAASTLTIRQLDEGTHARLRERAAKNGRSVEAEVRALLDAAVGRPEANLLLSLHAAWHRQGVSTWTSWLARTCPKRSICPDLRTTTPPYPLFLATIRCTRPLRPRALHGWEGYYRQEIRHLLTSLESQEH